MFIYFDDAFVKRIANNKITDNEKGLKTSLCIDGKEIRIYPFNIHLELMEELKYPAITWKRYDRKYDKTRFVYDPNSELFLAGDENKKYFIKYDAPKPYNFFYQVELRAKSQYEIDMMELWLESNIDFRGDYVSVDVYIEELKEYGVTNFPLDLVEYQVMDEDENSRGSNSLYRRIYSFSMSCLVDMNNFKKFDTVNRVETIILNLDVLDKE